MKRCPELWSLSNLVFLWTLVAAAARTRAKTSAEDFGFGGADKPRRRRRDNGARWLGPLGGMGGTTGVRWPWGLRQMVFGRTS